jgi:citronellol/citronellal dehydrogenase
MSDRFAGRRAVVTGSSRGIGAGIAQRLAAEGADVVLVARTLEATDEMPGSLRQTQAICERYGTAVGCVAADLSDDIARSGVIPRARDILGGPIDILVNNAAAAIAYPITEVTPAQQRLAYECNVIAPLGLAQAAIPDMRQAGAGWIVNLTSVGARLPEGRRFTSARRGRQWNSMAQPRQR